MMAPLRERSDFMKVMAFNSPKIAIVFAVIGVTIAGLLQPFLGWVWADLLLTLSIPVEYIMAELVSKGKDPSEWKTELKDDCERLALLLTLLGAATFVSYVIKSYLFTVLGENVTIQIRELLYKSILEKNIGWFDLQENQSSVLTSAMAQESAIINGASSESLGPYCESVFAIVGGLVLGFYFCWQEALITLACVPAIIIANYIAMEFEKGLSGATADSEKQANLLIGDAINNFKTVQSFGYEELIVKKFVSYIRPIYVAGKTKHLKSGIAYGFSQFIIYMVFAALFYAGGWVIDEGCEERTVTQGGVSMTVQECSIDPKDVFIALFAIFFGANHAGMAMSMGPDIGKAQLAATKIFKIIE